MPSASNFQLWHNYCANSNPIVVITPQTYPCRSLALMLAEYCRRVYATSLCPLRVARWRADEPFSSRYSKSSEVTLFSVMRRGGPSSVSSLTSFSLERNRLSRDLPLKSCYVMKRVSVCTCVCVCEREREREREREKGRERERY